MSACELHRSGEARGNGDEQDRMNGDQLIRCSLTLENWNYCRTLCVTDENNDVK